MFSEWTVLCVAEFLDDCDKVALAETCCGLLRCLRTKGVLDRTVFPTRTEQTQRLWHCGWNLAKLRGRLVDCVRLSDAQCAAVTHFDSVDSLPNPRFCQFPNLRSLYCDDGDSKTMDLSPLQQLNSVHVFCFTPRDKPSFAWQRMILPPSLRRLRMTGALPQAESCTLKRLSILNARRDCENTASFKFPALRSAHFFHTAVTGRCVQFLPETLCSLTLTAVVVDFERLVRFRHLKTLVLETELDDHCFVAFVAQLPETLEHINFCNSSPTRNYLQDLAFDSLRWLPYLQSLILVRVGGTIECNDLRNCKLLSRLTLRDMDKVSDFPKDPQTIWPDLIPSHITIN